MSILGTRVVRTEDPRLLTAGGTYTDDLRLPELAGAARVTFVRSPVAHARITGIDTEAAREAPGVLAVLTAADLDDLPPADGSATAEPLLAADRVRYVGEAVAIVVTEDGYQGEDTAELVSVDYDPLPAVASIADALHSGTLLFGGTESNVAAAGCPATWRPPADGSAVPVGHGWHLKIGYAPPAVPGGLCLPGESALLQFSECCDLPALQVSVLG